MDASDAVCCLRHSEGDWSCLRVSGSKTVHEWRIGNSDPNLLYPQDGLDQDNKTLTCVSRSDDGTVAMGCEDGSVIIVRGDDKQVVPSAINKPVQHIVFSGQKTLLAVTRAGDLFTVSYAMKNPSAQTFRCKKITALCFRDSTNFIGGDSKGRITEHSMSGGQYNKLGTFKSSVKLLSVCEDYIGITTQKGTFLYCKEDKSRAKLKCGPSPIAITLFKRDDTHILVLVLLKDQGAEIFNINIEELGQGDIAPVSKVLVAGDADLECTVRDVRFSNDATKVMVAYSSSRLLNLQQVDLFTKNGKFRDTLKVGGSTQKSVFKDNVNRPKKAKAPLTVLAQPELVSSMPMEIDGNDEEMASDDSGKLPRTLGELASMGDGNKKENELDAILLKQALESNDQDLLDNVLAEGVRETGYARTSAEVLPPSLVPSLLRNVSSRFRSRPSAGLMMVVWIEAILQTHASYLTAVPDILETLGGLYTTIDARTRLFGDFLKLSGRVNLLLQQSEYRKEFTTLSSANPSTRTAASSLREYESEDDEDDDAMDVQ